MSGCGGDASERSPERSQEELRAEFEARRVERRREDARRKADALAAGKEPFDLDRFFEFYIMESPPEGDLRERVIPSWERDYFTMRGQRFMTIEDYAKYLNEIDVYGH